MWAKPLDGGLYEIRNTPWSAYDVNWGDVVSCERMSEAGLPIVSEVSTSGGHRTLRVFFEDGDDSLRDSMLETLVGLGALYENADGRMYALDLAPEVDSGPVLDLLARKEEQGVLGWETGWS